MVKRINLKQIANILLNKNIEENEEKTKNKNWKLMKPMTKNTKLKELTDSGLLYIPLSQHIGSPSIPIIEIGDSVKKYEKIAEVSGNISANIHSPVSIIGIDGLPICWERGI